MIDIRPATPDDIPWLLSELKEFDKYYATKKKLFGDENYVREQVEKVMREHVFIIAEDDSDRVGFIAGIRQQHFYNPSITILVQLLWWVIPSYRYSLAARMLMDEFVEYGKENADWITFNMAAMTPINPKSLIRKGFKESDKVYLMEVE